MKKALAFLSALTFASASQSDGFLSDNELLLRPISYNPVEDFSLEDFPRKSFRGFPANFPTVAYVDDEQYANFNLVQNWHYPLPPLPMITPAEIQAHIEEEEDSVENALFDLTQMVKQEPRQRQPTSKPRTRRTQTQKPKHPNLTRPFYLPPSSMKTERQRY